MARFESRWVKFVFCLIFVDRSVAISLFVHTYVCIDILLYEGINVYSPL